MGLAAPIPMSDKGVDIYALNDPVDVEEIKKPHPLTCVPQTKGTWTDDEGREHPIYRALDEILMEDVLPMIENGKFTNLLSDEDGVRLYAKVVPAPTKEEPGRSAYRFAFKIEGRRIWDRVEGDYLPTPEEMLKAEKAINDFWGEVLLMAAELRKELKGEEGNEENEENEQKTKK